MTVLLNNVVYTCEESLHTGILLTLKDNFNYSSETFSVPSDSMLSEDQLFTKFCMDAASDSFKEDWENEDDDHWNSFLK